MSAWRGFLIVGAMAGLTAVASAAPARGKAHKAKPGQSVRHSQQGNNRHSIDGVVTAIHHHPGGQGGSLTIRLGGQHHHRHKAAARRPMHRQHQHRTETFAVNNSTKFEKMVGNSQLQVHFHDVHHGDRVKIFRQQGASLARLVDILGGNGRNRGTGAGSGGNAGRRSAHHHHHHKRPLRHALVRGWKFLRYLARHPEARRDLRQAVRQEARRLLAPQTRRAVARHPLMAARKAERVVRRQVLPQVRRLVENRPPMHKAGQTLAKVAEHPHVAPKAGSAHVAPHHAVSHPAPVTHHTTPVAHHTASAHHTAPAHHATSGHHAASAHRAASAHHGGGGHGRR